MPTPKSTNQLAVFDSLLDGLAKHATGSSLSPPQFFEKTIQVVETILGAESICIFASGSDEAKVLVASSATIAEDNTPSIVCPILRQRDSFKGEVAEAGQVWGSLDIWLNEKATSVQEEVANGLAEIVGDFVVAHSRATSSSKSWSEDLFRFTVNAHRSLDPVEAGFHLANDARLLMACERVSLFSTAGREPRLLAISSVATVESRSELITNMKSLAKQAMCRRDVVSSDQLAGQKSHDRIDKLVAKQVNSTGLPFLFGVPIFSSDDGTEANTRSPRKAKPIGFLLAESTEESDRFQLARGLRHVIPHVRVAIANSEQHAAIPFRKALGSFGKLTRWANLSKFAIGIGLFAAAIAAANLIQTEFKIRIHGELRPVVERNMFAPFDATVEAVNVGYGQAVSANETLVRLRSVDLEIEIDKTNKELEKLIQLKDAKEIALNQVSNSNADPSLAAQLASEVADIDFQIASLKETKTFLSEKSARLTVHSSISGDVTTWNVREVLINKPVRWGEPILNVAQLNGDWEVQFKVPERQIGYILDRKKAIENGDASNRQQVQLEVFLDSNPGKKYLLEIGEIDESASKYPDVGTVTRIRSRASVEIENKRQGASVSADVLCGKRSLWFVWTRELRDSLKRRFVW